MFDDTFYPKFDISHECGYQLYLNDVPLYGKDAGRAMKEYYNTDDYHVMFRKDINDAFREYARVCHIKIVYDSFTENMKNYLDENICKYHCEYQNMTRKRLFMLFTGASMELLYEVASFIFTYHDDVKDPHEEIFG